MYERSFSFRDEFPQILFVSKEKSESNSLFRLEEIYTIYVGRVDEYLIYFIYKMEHRWKSSKDFLYEKVATDREVVKSTTSSFNR